MRSFTVEQLRVQVHPTRDAMGKAAAAAVAARMREVAAARGAVRMVFAAAPSQNEFLGALGAIKGLPWDRVEAFHMDEYVGLAAPAPASFGQYLKTHIFDRVRPGRVELIDGLVRSEDECAHYAAMIEEAPIDIVCLGIGENGHLAFNDPPVADFHDAKVVKVVELDAACRSQQVHDGCFPALASVPTHALTLTIPALLHAAYLSCVVPGPTKAAAVRAALRDAVSTACPATALRHHAQCILYLDAASIAEYDRGV